MIINQASMLPDYLSYQAHVRPEKKAFSFLKSGELESESMNFRQLHVRACGLAATIADLGIVPGDRILILLPSGLDFIVAFFACLSAGLIAVPAQPPRGRRGRPRLRAIAANCVPALALTNEALLLDLQRLDLPELDSVPYLVVENACSASDWQAPLIGQDQIAFLQYTSGSTADPKGVCVTHANLVANQHAIRNGFAQDEHSVILGWLPMFHDMGLIGNVLQPVFLGASCFLMSPLAFLQKPLRWLAAIDRHRVTTSGGPNFAYDLCLRRISPADRSCLDLSSWRVAFNGSEPILADTLLRFAELFRPHGFLAHAAFPCYGLAESTLFVTGASRDKGPIMSWFQRDGLAKNQALPAKPDSGRLLVSSGCCLPEQELLIVDPESSHVLEEGQVGEIWLSGPSVAPAYWRAESLSAYTFDARLNYDPLRRPFLRTGDLGFLLKGQLYVTGRIKELIIIRGRNLYPRDIEISAASAHPSLIADRCAAFSLQIDDQENLVLVLEMKRNLQQDSELENAARMIRQVVAEQHGVRLFAVVLIRAGTLPLTTSGKLRRSATRTAYLEGTLTTLLQSDARYIQGQLGSARMTRDALLALPSSKRVAALAGDLLGRAARLARLEPDVMDTNWSLTSMGLDSLAMIELKSDLESDFDVDPPLALLLEGSQLSGLAAQLMPAILDPPKRAVPAVAEPNVFPLTYGQRALWFLQDLNPETTAFHLVGAAWIQGDLDISALQLALDRVTERHTALRTVFERRDGEPSQRALDFLVLPLIYEELGDIDRDAVLARFHVLAYEPFDLASGPLLRLGILDAGVQNRIIFLVLHHLISDFWSIGLLLSELEACYAEITRGIPANLEPAPAFARQALLEAATLAGPRGTVLWDWWRQHLAGPLPVLNLATDHPRPPVRGVGGAAAFGQLKAHALARLEMLALAHGTTLYTALLSVFEILLQRYCGQDEILLGTPTSGRSNASVDHVMGYFINPVVLRAHLGGITQFRDLLAKMRSIVAQAAAHQDFPFSLLAERLASTPDPSRSPLFQVFFVMEQARILHQRGLSPFALGTPGAQMSLLGNRLESINLPHRNAQFDLMFLLARRHNELALCLEYDPALFEATTINRMLLHYSNLVEEIVNAPDAPLHGLNFLTVSERKALLCQPDPVELTVNGLHQLFESQVAQRAQQAALIFDIDELTYGQLNQAANRLAHQLLALGVGCGQIVGIYLERGVRLVTSILAVLKCGAAYLPLDRHYPPERLAYIMGDVFDGSLSPTLIADALPEGLILPANTQVQPAMASLDVPEHNPDLIIHPGEMAYIIHTSGSSGRPKGVPVGHDHVLHLLMATHDLFHISADDVWSMCHSYAFDFSVWEIWGALAFGGRLVIVPRLIAQAPLELLSLLDSEGVTVLNQTPAAFYALDRADAEEQYQLAALRLIIFGGEALDVLALSDWFKRRGDCPILCNMYGITETTVHVTCHFLSASDERTYIGSALPHLSIFLKDRQGRPVATGVPGEIHVGGAALSCGYLGQPALTALRFVPHPFTRHAGSRLYRSGDLARVSVDGELEYRGRIDHQVQLRGFRIEPDEIAAVLNGLPDIDRAIVSLQKNSGQLVVYLTPADPNGQVDCDAARSRLHRELPDYMVPSAFAQLERFPLTASGKIDRDALPQLRGQSQQLTQKTAPRDETESRLLMLWSELLGTSELGIHDDFFEKGGHSLKATELMSRVETRFGVKVPLKTLFEGPTVAQLAEYIGHLDGSQAVPLTVMPQWLAAPEECNEPFPLTDIQQAYWIGRNGEFALGTVSTQSYLELELTSANLLRLERAWNQIITRHDMLRAVVLPNGEQQVLALVPTYAFEVLDLSDLDSELRQKILGQVRDRMSSHVLPADRWPLFQIRATRLGSNHFHLHTCLDALIYDAWSAYLLLNEWMDFYWNPTSELPPIEISFRDYVFTVRELRETPAWQRAHVYWLSRLKHLPLAPQLSLATRPESLTDHRFHRRCLRLPAPVWGRIKQRATRIGISPSCLQAAVFGRILAMWSSNPHFTLNLTLFQRLPLHQQVQAIVGDFTSLTLLEVENKANDSFEQGARALQHRLWADLDHSAKSGVDVLRDLAREHGVAAAMPVVFTSTLGLDEELDLSRLPGKVVHSITQTSQVWLDYQVSEEEGALVANWDGVEALFPLGMLEAMFTSFQRLLYLLADQEHAWNQPFSELDLLPADQKLLQLSVNRTESPLQEGLLQQSFFRAAASHAELPAIVTDTKSLSYEELAAQVRSIGSGLRERGAVANSLVAIVMEKGWQQVAATLGVLSSSAAYLPLDPDLPLERILLLLEQGECSLVLTQPDLIEHFAWPDSVQVLTLDCFDELVEPVSDWSGSADDIAYVIFTSGSTGVPKGVMTGHRGALNTCSDMIARFQMNSDDRVFAISSLSFDLSVFDIFATLAVGAAVVVPPPESCRDPAHWALWVQKHRVSIWNSVPALVDLYIEHLSSHPALLPVTLRLVLMSGDWIPINLPDRIRWAAPAARIISLGGATEASIWSILHEIGSVGADQASIPYGKAMLNQSMHVLDEGLSARPTWVPGFLYIGGLGLAQGYWRDKAKTRASFICHPRSGQTLYRTGDLGRFLPDGSIEFLGREDFQVKIQGFRVELGEIEAVLLSHSSVREAVVTVRNDLHGERRLIAHVTGAADTSEPNIATLRDFLAARLPRYMVPSNLFVLDSLPLTANGKVDRSCLALPQAATSSATKSVEPSHEARSLTARITALVAEVLVDLTSADLDAHTNLFNLGATSLEVIRLANRLEKEFGRRPSVQAFYQNPTINALVTFFFEPEPQAADPADLPRFQVIMDADKRLRFKAAHPGLRSMVGTAIQLESDPELTSLYGQRRSIRHFRRDAIPLEHFSHFISCLQLRPGHQAKRLYPSAGGLYPVQVYLHVKEGRIEDLAAGIYYHHPHEQALYAIDDTPDLGEAIHDPFVNLPIFRESAFSLFLITELGAIAPLYGEQGMPFSLLEAGYVGQLLMMQAARLQIGLCPIGVLDFDAIRPLFKLDESQLLVHSFLGGTLDPLRLSAEEVVSQSPTWQVSVEDDVEEGEL